MKKGKIIYIDKKAIDKEIEDISNRLRKEGAIVEYASDSNEFYSIPEATLILLKRGVKQVSAISLSLPQIEVPIYWSTF